MGMALVYHETQQFVRLVQIMPLNHTIWQFLEPMQRSGAPLPRATLVQRCTSDQVCALQHTLLRQFACGTPDFRHPPSSWAPDAASVVQAVLRFVADNARAAAAAGASSQLQVAFSAVLTAEVLQASPGRLSKDTVVRPLCPGWLACCVCSSVLVRRCSSWWAACHCTSCTAQALLLPNVRTGFGKGGGIDMRAAAHIVLAQLVSRATMSSALLSGALPLSTSCVTGDSDAGRTTWLGRSQAPGTGCSCLGLHTVDQLLHA